ncbi:hypothetical protein [Acinetobacter baumannii]|uniref:hypothetical protein n=1 Tax=Acinetobacter baumannii TaxID=470 RepID=UPI001EDAA6BD|nr:hypothetical protein [Acinetobacter baumannii]
MQFIKDSFTDKVRTGKIKSPLRQDFSLEKWKSASKITDFDKQLETAGLLFHLQFSAIRQALNEIKKANLPLNNVDFLHFFIGIANRNSVVLKKQMEQYIPKDSNTFLDLELHETILKNNPLDIELTINEAVIGAIDGIYYNITTHLSESKKIINLEISNEEIFENLQLESAYSQIYDIYEKYWNSILYEQMTLSIIDNNIELRSNDILMIPYLISDTRRTQKELHGILVAKNIIREILNKRNYVEYKNNNFFISNFDKLRPKKKVILENCQFTFTEKTISFLPKEIPNKNFDINDVIEIFLQLCSISLDILDNCPNDTEIPFGSYQKLKSFSPAINTNNLIKGISLATSKKEDTVREIINFLTFQKSEIKLKNRSDLWRTPIIKINENEIIFILEPLLHPVGTRCFEGWMANAGVELKEKGIPFEEFIKQRLNSALKKNSYINNFKIIEHEVISIDGESEEIDLLVVIDNLIIIGEAKCILSTDSAISYWNALNTIKRGSKQAIKKNNFIRKNLEKFIKQVGLNYNPNIQYITQPIVITSNSIGVGYSFFDVPIVDTTILVNYFNSPICPLISTSQQKHLVYLKLYENLETLIYNFQKFIKNPPPIQSYKIYGNTIHEIPIISPYDNFKTTWRFKRLAITEVSSKKILEHDFGFPMIINDEV